MSEHPPRTPAVSRKELEDQVAQDAKQFAESQKIGIDLGSEWAESAADRMKKLSKLVGEVEDLNKPYYQNLSGKERGPIKTERAQRAALLKARANGSSVLLEQGEGFDLPNNPATRVLPERERAPIKTKDAQRKALTRARAEGKSTFLEYGKGFDVPEGKVTDFTSTEKRFEATRESSKADNPRAYMLAERANVAEERTALLEATRKHAQAYGEFHKRHNIVSRLFRRAQVATGLGSPEDAGRLAALKHREEQAQIAYAQKLETSVIARLTAEGKDQEYIDKVRARYNRLIQFHEVIKPADDAKKASRIEALNTKEKDVLEKGMGWFGGLNNKLEQTLGKNGARAVRLIATSGIATAGVVALSSLGLVAGVAVGSYAGFRLLKAVAGTVAGAYVGGVAGRAYQVLRTDVNQEKSKTARSGSIGSAKDIRKQAAAYEAGTEEGMAKRRMFLESIVAGLAGAGLSYEIATNIASIEAVGDAIKATALDTGEYLRDIAGIPENFGEVGAVAPGIPLPLGEDAPIQEAQKVVPQVAEKTVIPPTEAKSLTWPASHDSAPVEKSVPVPAQPIESVPPPSEVPEVTQPEVATEPDAAPKASVAPEVEQGAPVATPDTEGAVPTEVPPSPDTQTSPEAAPIQEHASVESMKVPAPVEEVAVDPDADAAARAALEPSPSYEGTPSDVGTIPSQDLESAASVQISESAPQSPSLSLSDLDESMSSGSSTIGLQDAVSQLTQPSVEVPETSSVPVPSVETMTTDAPTTLGVKEAISQFNAPPSPEMPDTASSVDVPFTNNYGVPVNPQLIGAYTWQVPGTDVRLPMAFGGPTGEYSDWAMKEVLKHPGETRLFVTQVQDPLTGTITPRVDSWSIDATGKPELTRGVVNPINGKPLPPINPQDFIRRLP